MNTETPRRGSLGVIITSVVMGFLYAYPTWSAIGNLVSLPAYYSTQLGVTNDKVPWALLITGVALPVIVFTIGVALGWKRGAGATALFLTAGFALVSALALDVLAAEKETEIRLVIEYLTNKG
jgi:hypothetical protein